MVDLTDTNQTTSRIGKYEIRRELGRGAMGMVYEGFDPDIRRRVAIKTLHAHLIADASSGEFLERFRREAQAAARCMHANIVTVLEYGEHQGAPFIAMEFVEGESLDALIKRGDPMPLKQQLKVISQTLNALHVAHAQGVVHRDIKPANIMVLPDGNVKLADFGIARIPTDHDLTQTGMAVGTPRFMAPEQFFAMEVDGRADLFSVTRVFLELLTLLPPGLRISMVEMPEFFGLPASNRIDFNRQVPAALVPFLERGMAANPDERIADVKAYAAELKSAMGNMVRDKAEAPTPAPKPSSPSDVIDDAQTRFETHVGLRPGDDHPTDDLTGIDTGTGRSGHLFAGFAAQLDEDTLTRLKADYASLIGPSASRLVQEHAEDAISFAELIHALGNSIDNQKQRQRFMDRWAG